MMKKILFMLMAFILPLQAQNQAQEEFDPAFQELLYDIGMQLAQQNKIVDVSSAKVASDSLYQNVPQLTQLVDLYLMVDEACLEQNITNLDSLIDYTIQSNELFARAMIAWLGATQNLFVEFVSLYGSDASFDDWCSVVMFMASLEGNQPENPAYLNFWLAGVALLQAQENLGNAFRALE